MAPPGISPTNSGTIHGNNSVGTSAQPVSVTVTSSEYKNNPKVPPQVFTASRVKDPQQGFTEPLSLNGKTFYFKDNGQTTNLKIAYLLDKDHHKLQAKVSPLVTPVKTPTANNGNPQQTPTLSFVSYPQSRLTNKLSGTQQKPVVQNQSRPKVVYTNDGTHGIPYHGPLGLGASKGKGIDLPANQLDLDTKNAAHKVPPFHFTHFSRPHTVHGPSMRVDPNYVKQQQQQQQQAQAGLRPDQPLAMKPTRDGNVRSA
jgi:hypothetical protein